MSMYNTNTSLWHVEHKWDTLITYIHKWDTLIESGTQWEFVGHTDMIIIPKWSTLIGCGTHWEDKVGHTDKIILYIYMQYWNAPHWKTMKIGVLQDDPEGRFWSNFFCWIRFQHHQFGQKQYLKDQIIYNGKFIGKKHVNFALFLNMCHAETRKARRMKLSGRSTNSSYFILK